MNPAQPLFVISIARSGGNLLARLLSAHSQVTVAADPFLPIYRSFRNAALLHAIGRTTGWSATEPIQDYYFRDERIEQLDALQHANLDLPVEQSELPRLHEEIRQRLEAQCRDLIPSVPMISGKTYRELVATALEVVASTRFTPGMRWCGTKEVWTIEFIQPLARAFPTARFVVLFRDVRAVVASMLALGATEPASAAQPLSYARHWRKQYAFLRHLEHEPAFAPRLCAIRYEDLVTNAAATIGELCRFLGIEPETSMIDGGQWRRYPGGEAWRGNSSFDSDLRSISPEQNRHWQYALSEGVRSLLRVTCREELAALGYAPGEPEPTKSDYQRAVEHLVRSSGELVSWRSDLGDARRDVQAERARRDMLQASVDPPASEVRRSFLFREAFDVLRRATLFDRLNGESPEATAVLPWKAGPSRSSVMSV